MNIEKKILLSRFLTRSGDQAWDFAVPLVLIQLFPSSMRMAFIYFFVIKLGTVMLMPTVGRLIDNYPRLRILQLGIAMQTVFVLLVSVFIYLIYLSDRSFSTAFDLLVFGCLTIFGFLASTGSNILDIAVANDLVPSALSSSRLPYFNSRLRQLDLLTEVSSPIAAGAILLLDYGQFQFFGFFLIVGWNILSFYPEYFLLNGVLKENLALASKSLPKGFEKSGIFEKLTSGWRDFINEPISLVILAYSLLWISVLSPHGVLLTAFLKGGWSLSEPVIGGFRALGAVFGLGATFLFPLLHNRYGVIRTSRMFIFFQVLMVSIAFAFFFIEGAAFQLLFLLFILFSRIGLYGFGLGETEIRQMRIPESKRGHINGVASSLTSLATLIIFGLGIIFPSKDDFVLLVATSVSAVILASLVFVAFTKKYA